MDRTHDVMIIVNNDEGNRLLRLERQGRLPHRLYYFVDHHWELRLWLPEDLFLLINLWATRKRTSLRKAIAVLIGLPGPLERPTAQEDAFLQALTAGEDCWAPYCDWLQDNHPRRGKALLACLGVKP